MKHRSSTITTIGALIIVIAMGFIAGVVSGNILMRQFITGKGTAALLLYRPSFEYFRAVRLLNNDNEFKRIEGYYALYDIRKVDIPFLLDRYERENSIYIKRTIVWLMGFSGNAQLAIRAYSGIYDASPDGIKKEILRSIIRLDRDSIHDFLKKHTAKDAVLREL